MLMASQSPPPNAGVLQVPSSRRCSARSSQTGAQFHREDPGKGSGPAETPAAAVAAAAAAEGSASCLPRNVLSERERRKRISVSCEHLRALLPQFRGRREDMVSVLEMSVQFLQFASPLVPSGEQHAVLTPSKEGSWRKRRKDNLHRAHQTPPGAPEPDTGASMTMQQGPPSCVVTGMDQDEAHVGVAEMLDRPESFPGPSSLVPRMPGLSPSKVLGLPPAWPPCSWSPLLSEEAQSCLGQAGPLTEGTDRAVMSGTRSLSGCDVEDGPSFLLTASPDWCLGSLEGRGSSAHSRAPARSTPLDRTEPGFLVDPEPGSQKLPDGPLEPWGWDTGCASLALRDEVDTIFPDFFAY